MLSEVTRKTRQMTDTNVKLGPEHMTLEHLNEKSLHPSLEVQGTAEACGWRLRVSPPPPNMLAHNNMSVTLQTALWEEQAEEIV